MGTRSVIFVTGKIWDADTRQQTIRLYRHWDGEPTANLRALHDAIKTANKVLAKYQILKPEAEALPAMGFASCIIAATLNWTGFAAQIDTEGAKDDDTKRAIFPEAFCPRHYGEQCDLEWVYVVNVPARTVTIYHWGYGTVAEHIAHGPVDPVVYVDELVPEAQGSQRRAISGFVRAIESLDWRVNPTKRSDTSRCVKRATA